MLRLIRFLLPLVLCGFMTMGCSSPRKTKVGPEDCKVCERIEIFATVRQSAAASYWSDFGDAKMVPPLLYFSDSLCWLAFADSSLFPQKTHSVITCPNGTRLIRYDSRLDSIPFHMENKMDFGDSTLPIYFNPIMFCSDVEAASALVPEVQHTEEWMQMVMHEYFHGFQFRHPNCLHYLADSVTVMTDSLHGFYRNETWFREALARENAWLLKALSDSSDEEAGRSILQFLEERKNRREKFRKQFGFDIAPAENFWEKIEGTARYMEYNAGFVYHKFSGKPAEMKHDPKFNQWKDYTSLEFVDRPWFKDKTEIMVAYYYVTGFNLCRLLDKLQIEYKYHLFDDPARPLDRYLVYDHTFGL